MQQSLPSVLAMTKKYSGGDVWAALLANANVGGENVHRGGVLGVLLGAEKGASSFDPRLASGLYHGAEIAAEVDAVLAALDK